ncbi:hypothetical protein EDL99_04870 [Ornithobacterium rhinotracheale]|nr:hypothetical protein [Ornithobacterium rhinotracheale]
MDKSRTICSIFKEINSVQNIVFPRQKSKRVAWISFSPNINFSEPFFILTLILCRFFPFSIYFSNIKSYLFEVAFLLY